ncbi:MAG: EcsC family protein [Bacteroidia bacterium]
MAKLNSTEQKLLQDIEGWKETGPGFLNSATHIATKPLIWAAGKLIPDDIQGKMSAVSEKIAEKLQDASQWTVREEEVLKATKEFEIDSTTILELQKASVFDLNHVAEEFVKFNTRLAAAEGFGTGLLGWAGLLADLPALFVLNFRMLYQISLSFGYRVEPSSEEGAEPFEVGYMLHIFKIATASSSEAKEAALLELKQYEEEHPDGISRVGSEFTRNQFGKNAAINISRIIINQIVKETLARKAITSIPGIGAVLTAGFNYYYVQDVGRTAIMIYQERFLLDKKGRKKIVTVEVE